MPAAHTFEMWGFKLAVDEGDVVVYQDFGEVDEGGFGGVGL